MSTATPGLIVIAELHGLAGRASELKALLATLASGSLSEPGCVDFRVLDPGGPGEVVLVSTYANEAALRAHYDTPHYRHYRAGVGELLARSSDVVIHHISQTIRPVDPNLPDPAMLG